ncbi:MAG: BCD family MFS transporter [Pseudomonadota bacterium]
MAQTSGSALAPFGWIGVIRLGLVQTALGAIVVLTTSTLNRIMVVELALPAALPGALVGWHYAVQMARPHFGHGADVGGARAPWIIGGMATLCIGGFGAACATALMQSNPLAGVLLAIIAFLFIGAGVGAAGTNLLALLATRTAPERKAAAAAIVWIMMIFGFVLTAGVVGAVLDPFSMERLLVVAASVGVVAFIVATLAVLGVEGAPSAPPIEEKPKPSLAEAVRAVWDERQARRFTIFVFVSMLAYSAQDLILEPFAGLVHGYAPGESTKLAGVQNGGVLLGMIATAVIGTLVGRSRAKFMRRWTMAGCLASAAALGALAYGAAFGGGVPLQANVFALGAANGAFAVAAIGSMMALASVGENSAEGVRMGVWGASQAIAFGVGGFLGAVALDAARAAIEATGPAFAIVFAAEGTLFLVAAALALRVGASDADNITLPAMPAGEPLPAE